MRTELYAVIHKYIHFSLNQRTLYCRTARENDDVLEKEVTCASAFAGRNPVGSVTKRVARATNCKELGVHPQPLKSQTFRIPI